MLTLQKTKTMGKIFIEDMEFFAFHGHYDEEKYAGSRFAVSLYMWTDTTKAEQTDNLEDALNYQDAYVIVNDVMTNTKSNLVENVAYNISRRLFESFPTLEKCKIKIAKINPAMGGKMRDVGVEIEYSHE